MTYPVLVDGRGRPFGSDGRESEYVSTIDLLQERIAELEFALEGDNTTWQLFGTGTEFEFSRDWLYRIVRVSRLSYLKNPLIQRAVNVRAYYTWGRGLEVNAQDEQVDTLIQEFLGDRGNRDELFDHQNRLLTDVELATDGNLFLLLFTNPATGKVRVRSCPVEQIADCVYDTQDEQRVRFWKRVYVAQRLDYGTGRLEGVTEVTWYPDWQYFPARTADRPHAIGGYPVNWDCPIMHVKSGGTKRMRYGVPETYAALDWAKAHKEFLENWATVVASLARFSWQMVTRGSKVAAAKTRLNSSVTGSDVTERNPAPVAGSVFIGDAQSSLTPIPKTGATTNADDNRQLKLMVAAAMDLPETFFGDANVGNHATAKTLDRPTELAITSRQQMWADVYRDLIGYMLDWQARAPRGSLPRGQVILEDDRVVVEHDVDATIDVVFPSVLDHDIEARITAIVNAATLAGGTSAGTLPQNVLVRLLATELGVQDVEEVVETTTAEAHQLGAAAEQAFASAVSDLRARMAGLPAAGTAPEPAPSDEA